MGASTMAATLIVTQSLVASVLQHPLHEDFQSPQNQILLCSIYSRKHSQLKANSETVQFSIRPQSLGKIVYLGKVVTLTDNVNLAEIASLVTNANFSNRVTLIKV